MFRKTTWLQDSGNHGPEEINRLVLSSSDVIFAIIYMGPF